jgi:hypothetical protein
MAFGLVASHGKNDRMKVYNQETPGEESFEFTLTAAEQELILKEVRDPAHVLDWVRHPRSEGGTYCLQVDQVTELYEAIESFAYMYEKSAETQRALQRLVTKLESMVEDYYRGKYPNVGARAPSATGHPLALRASPSTGPNQRCPCGSGKKYKKCCGRFG